MKITIWLDLAFGSNISAVVYNSSIFTHVALCKVDSYLITFRDLNKCINYINHLHEKDEKVILIITSGAESLSAVMIVLQQLPQLDSIYVIDSKETNTFTETLDELPGKLRGVYRDQVELCNQLNKISDTRRSRCRNSLPGIDFTFASLGSRLTESSVTFDTTASTLTTTNQDAVEELDDSIVKHQEAEFMYAQCLCEVLIKIPSSKEEMVAFCRQKYSHSGSELNIIDEFDAYYVAWNAIFWYTRDTFLYKLLNQALREQDIDTLYSLRYFINDLHSQLQQRHVTQQQMSTTATTSEYNVDDSQTETVYRGQIMEREEFEKKLQQSIKGFFCVNSFFSTTRHANLAGVYAGNLSRDPASSTQSVLFRIDIDRRVNKFPYANVSTENAFGDTENEILFTMGAVFKVYSINLNDEGFWNIHLKLTGEEDEELKTLSDYNKKELTCLNPLGNLGKLMLRMGEFQKAELYYLAALQDPTMQDHRSSTSGIFNDLGVIYDEIGLLDKSIEFYEKSLEIDLEHLSANDPELATLYNNLGNVYRKQGDYEKALASFQQSLSIEQSSSDQDQTAVAFYYNNIGLVYNEQQQYSEALLMFETSLEVRLKALPANHPDLSESYNNISRIYDSLGDNEQAAEYMNKTLQNDLRSLPPDHPILATTYNNLAKTLYKQGKLRDALHCMKKAEEILSKNLPTDPKVTLIQEWINDREKELREIYVEEIKY